MVKCVCGKAIDKMPDWLRTVNVEFVCNNCPKRQVKTIAQLQAEQVRAAGASEERSSEFDDVDDDEDDAPDDLDA